MGDDVILVGVELKNEGGEAVGLGEGLAAEAQGENGGGGEEGGVTFHDVAIPVWLVARPFPVQMGSSELDKRDLS